MRVGSGVILFQLAGFLTSALADFYFAKHILQLQIIQTGKNRRNNPDAHKFCWICDFGLYRRLSVCEQSHSDQRSG